MDAMNNTTQTDNHAPKFNPEKHDLVLKDGNIETMSKVKAFFIKLLQVFNLHKDINFDLDAIYRQTVIITDLGTKNDAMQYCTSRMTETQVADIKAMSIKQWTEGGWYQPRKGIYND